MIVGYARTSTVEQVAGFEGQKAELAQAGVERLFEEQVSSVAQRAQLKAALDFVREGDTFVVTKLDRLARSTQHLLDIVAKLDGKKVALKVLGLGIDSATPTGRMLISMLAAVGQFEREIMLERQREGIAKAQREGKFKGRAPTAMRQRDEVLRLTADGYNPTQITRRLNISRASIYRILNQQEAA